MTDEELKQLVASLAIDQKELTKKMMETEEQMRRTDEQMREQMRHTDEQMRRTDEQIRRNSDEVKQFMLKTEAEIEKVSQLLGNIGQNQGDVAEEFFFNSLQDEIRLGSIHFDDISRNDRKIRGKTQEEYDIIMTNGETVGIIEVKYKAHEKDLDKLERKMRNFKKLFPVYQNYKLYGAIASFHIYKEAKQQALQRGFFVLERSGQVIHTECAAPSLIAFHTGGIKNLPARLTIIVQAKLFYEPLMFQAAQLTRL
jgi:hypothetical protein